MFEPGVPPPHEDAVAYLVRLSRNSDNAQFVQMIRDRDGVYSRYGHIFHPDRLDRLTGEDLKEFLRYDSNRHWWGINRHQAKLVQDVAKLRRVLARLLDESQPIDERLTGSNPGPVRDLFPVSARRRSLRFSMWFTRRGMPYG